MASRSCPPCCRAGLSVGGQVKVGADAGPGKVALELGQCLPQDVAAVGGRGEHFDADAPGADARLQGHRAEVVRVQLHGQAVVPGSGSGDSEQGSGELSSERRRDSEPVPPVLVLVLRAAAGAARWTDVASWANAWALSRPAAGAGAGCTGFPLSAVAVAAGTAWLPWLRRDWPE